MHSTDDTLNRASRLKRTGATVVLAVTLAGCAAVQDFLAPLGSAWESTPEVMPIEERPRQDPISRNYFELASPEQSVIGEPQIVFTSEENTFSDLAREYGLGFDELVAANPEVDPWLPGADTPVLLPTQYILPDVPREGIVLNIASKRLFYFPEAEEGRPQTVLTYPIGIGRVGWETPLGSSAVIAKARDPSWYVPASVRRENRELGYPDPSVVPPGPDNPLGKFVLKLDLPGYLIHGTNQPYGVGMRVSHGCVRLYPENIELLYELVGLGEPVVIINEPYLAGQRDGELYFEGHAPLEDDEVSGEDHLQKIFTALHSSAEESSVLIDEEQVRAIADEALGLPIRIQKADIAEVMARTRVIRNTVEQDPNMPTLEEVRALLDESIEGESVGEQVAIDE
jgi:L,D-transpeptidase ErfK/SrfK